MKTFFKKLSLVLAAAMIITLVPATTASAEDLKALAIAKQNEKTAASYAEIKVGQQADFKFFGASDWKELGWTWSIADEKIATVDKAGLVTAKAEGFTTLSVAIPSYKTATLPIYVTGDGSNALALGESKATVDVAFALEAGKSIDLNFYGATGYKSGDVVTWSTSDAAVAKVDNKGVVTAIAAGTAIVNCGVSVAATGKSYLGKAVITVGKSAVADFSIAQKDANTVAITFATADQATKDVKVERVVSLGNGATSNILWAVSDESSVKDNVLTLKTYVPFSTGTYRFTVGNVSKLYEAGIGDPATLSLTYKNPLTEEDFEAEGAGRNTNAAKLVVKDAKGIELDVSDPDDYTITYSSVAEKDAYVDEQTGDVLLYGKESSITVKVLVEYGEEDENGNRKSIEGYATVKPGKLVKYGFDSAITASGIVTNNALTTKAKVDAGLGKYEITINSTDNYYVASLIKDSLDQTWALSAYAYDAEKYPQIVTNDKVADGTYSFKYSVTNVNKAFIDPNTGKIIGVTATEAGQPVYVLITLEKEVEGKTVNLGIVGAVPVTVKAESAPKTLTLDKTSAKLLTSGAYSTVEVTATTKDQYNKTVTDEIKSVVATVNKKVYSDVAADSEGGIAYVVINGNKFTIDASKFAGQKVNTLTFKVTMKSGLTANFSLSPKDSNVANLNEAYRIVAEDGYAKFKAANAVNTLIADGKISVRGTYSGFDYETATFYVGVPTDGIAVDSLYLEITKPDGTKVPHATAEVSEYAVKIVDVNADNVITFNKLGAYTLKLFKGLANNKTKFITSSSLKLTNTLSFNPVLTVTSDEAHTADPSMPFVATGENKNFELKINGKDVTEIVDIFVEADQYTVLESSSDLYVRNATVRIPYQFDKAAEEYVFGVTPVYFEVEVPVNKHFTIVTP